MNCCLAKGAQWLSMKKTSNGTMLKCLKHETVENDILLPLFTAATTTTASIITTAAANIVAVTTLITTNRLRNRRSYHIITTTTAPAVAAAETKMDYMELSMIYS